MITDVIRVIAPATLAFAIGIALSPLLTHYLYKYKAWKKKPRTTLDGAEAVMFNALHKERETGTPRMGGMVIWLSSFVTIAGIWLMARLVPGELIDKFDFLSRNQTWIPLFTLMSGSLIGLIDDMYEVTGRGGHVAGGMSLRKRLFLVAAIALFIGWWFYAKLEVATIALPFLGSLFVGPFIIPLFMLTALALYAGGVIDGIDGLAGGIFSIIFLAYAGIAFSQGQFDLAAFCATVAGATLAFLWFNIPPARFYMSETGMIGLTATLSVIAFLTHAVLPLLVIAFPLYLASASVILQLISKKLRNGKKLFLIAPIHHHFEALGWPGYKVTMRFWIVSVIFAILGMIIAVLG